jgi:hypothetical protein
MYMLATFVDLGVTEGYGECDSPDWFNSFSVKPYIKELRRFLELLSIKIYFINV